MAAGLLVLTSNDALAERARILRAHGSQPKYYHRLIGGNFRIDALQAAVLSVKLAHLDAWTRGRQENAARYERLFKAKPFPQVGLPVSLWAGLGLGHPHIYNQFVLRVEQRDALRDFLGKHGIGAEVYYPVPLHLQECFSYLGCQKGSLPESERAALQTLALPIYPELTEEQQRAVVARIAEFYGE